MIPRRPFFLGIVGIAALAGLMLVMGPRNRFAVNPPRAHAEAPAPPPPVTAPDKTDIATLRTSVARRLSAAATSEKNEIDPIFAEFADWSSRYLGMDPAARTSLLAEGIALARERRVALAALIRRDPEAALASAVPMVVRQQLPPEIVSLLEDRVTGRGELSLLAVTPVAGAKVTEPVFRSALIGRQEYRAYVYGRRAIQGSLESTSLVGIAVDKAMAVSESPLRVLEAGELVAGRPVIELCEVSGKTTAVTAGAPLNVAAPVAVEYEGKIHLLCEPGHAAILEKQLIAREDDHTTQGDNQPGSSNVSGRPAQSWTHGTKKVLIIRVDFSDLLGAPKTLGGTQTVDEDFAVNLFNSANGVRDFYVENSYNKTTLQIGATVAGNSPDVTDVLRMPATAASYATSGNNDLLHSDARAAATVAGFDLNAYDRIGVVFSSLGGFASSQITYGGLGSVIGRYFWANGEYDFRVVAHEIGHNYGLNHANLWQVSDANPVSPAGSSTEYGDPFDVMGSGNAYENEFSHWNKSILQWIPDTAVTLASAAGTFRIYRFDAAAANLANPRALKIVRDSTIDYWIGYRRATSNASLDGGAYVLWGYNNNQQGNLLDLTTPGTNPNDPGLAIGATFNDAAAGITIHPVAQGGSGAEEYLDVQVTFQPRVLWSQSTYVVDEQGGSAVLTLRRTSNSVGALSVNYATAPGTATSPGDFTAKSGTVTWLDGDASDKTVTITVVPDAVAEGTENFTVTLSGVSGGVVAGNPTATVTVADAGARDTSFNADFINSSVLKVLPLSDGRTIIAGWFNQVQGDYSRRGLTLLTATGAIDPDFDADGGGGSAADAFGTSVVYDVARQADGNILVVGQFTSFNGTARNRIARLFPDGSLDASFNPGTGANGTIYAVLPLPSGKILIGGTFTAYNGTAREYLARLNSDGSLDTGFVGPDFGGTSTWSIETLAVQPDGKILAGGQFYFSGTPFKSGLCRVLATGALDPAFSGLTNGAHTSSDVNTLRTVAKIVVQPDGKILVAGDFTAFNGTANVRGGVARLTSTGAIDAGFAPTSDGSGNALLLQPDGKIIFGGLFTTVNGAPASNMVRLTSAGATDAPFSAPGGHGSGVQDFAMQADGRVLLGGVYASFQGSAIGGPAWRFFAGMPGLPGVIQFAGGVAQGNEGGTVTLSVTRTGGSLGALTVGYSTVPGTATTADYTTTSGVLTWADGDTATKTIVVSLTADALNDTPETFTVNLGQPLIGGAILGPTQQVTVTINNAAPVSGDFNADGKSDILWRNKNTGEVGTWLMNGTAITGYTPISTVGLTYTIAGMGDFNGDGKTDVLWRNTSTGEVGVWLMNGTAIISYVPISTVGLTYAIAGTGDFNGDGKVDILFRNTATGEVGVWLMNGTAITSYVPISTVGLTYAIAGTGDFNSDGKVDIIWRNKTTGEVGVWLMNGIAISSYTVISTADLNYVIANAGEPAAAAAVPDFNADGKTDLLLRNNSTGEVGTWLMNGTAITSYVPLSTVGLTYTIAGTGDFNGDGKADVLWRNTSTGEVGVWLMNGTAISSYVPISTVSLTYAIAGTGDFNGDGKVDILFRNTVTGEVGVWLMNGTAIISYVPINTVSLTYAIAGTGDFNGDGAVDILWRNTATGEVGTWLMNGTAVSSYVVISSVSMTYAITGTGDFNGDGKVDIIWRHTGTGEVDVWLLNGTAVTSYLYVSTLALAWEVSN